MPQGSPHAKTWWKRMCHPHSAKGGRGRRMLRPGKGTAMLGAGTTLPLCEQGTSNPGCTQMCAPMGAAGSGSHRPLCHDHDHDHVAWACKCTVPPLACRVLPGCSQKPSNRVWTRGGFCTWGKGLRVVREMGQWHPEGLACLLLLLARRAGSNPVV